MLLKTYYLRGVPRGQRFGGHLCKSARILGPISANYTCYTWHFSALMQDDTPSFYHDPMGDPFSVAGTAVGITSLGIQVFQILVQYYSQYKGFHDDIDSVLRQAEGLRAILESVQRVKESLEAENYAPSSQLHVSLTACKDVLNRLKKMADQCNTATTADGLQARLRYASKRMLWPFRKETVKDIQVALSTFQDNLTLALHCAGLDAVLRKFDDLQPAMQTLNRQTFRIENTLTHQTGAIELLHRDVMESQVSQVQQHEVMARELYKIRSTLQAEVSQQTAALESMCDILVSFVIVKRLERYAK